MIEPAPRPVLRPIPRWVIVVGIPVMVLVAAGAVWVLLGTGVSGGQLDAIRTGGTLGVGLGGIVVLWLAVRRQRSTELDLLQKYEAHRLAERVAATGEEDATARRITELYAKAVDQLGSDKAPVRLGGLYALERLAQDNADPQLRQTVANVLCAYLRMPTPDTGGRPHTVQQEREVRRTAQRILEHHLKPGPDVDHPLDSFWPAITLDLTGATLGRFDLSDCVLDTARFAGTTFTQKVTFHRTRFVGEAMFTNAVFAGDASFDHATFAGPTDFTEATCRASASFFAARFHDDVRFGTGTFADHAVFAEAEFGGDAWFTRCDFGGYATFTGATFGADAWFDDSGFADGAGFTSARFERSAMFGNTRFAGLSTFADAEFSTGAWFEGAQFEGHTAFAARVRVDHLDTDKVCWPDGVVLGDEPAPIEGRPGTWVRLGRVRPG
ncbi:pentapeptide repeat-containing protein [Actinophytocola sp. KF-1]